MASVNQTMSVNPNAIYKKLKIDFFSPIMSLTANQSQQKFEPATRSDLNCSLKTEKTDLSNFESDSTFTYSISLMRLSKIEIY